MSEDIDLALDLAWSIQRFRNLPMLLRVKHLRSTTEFADLCRAWEAFVEKYPEARLTQETMKR